MKIFFVINPNAGKGLSLADISKMKDFFNQRIGYFHYSITRNKEDISIQTRLALHNGYKYIVAVGGDGTIQQVVNGFFENGTIINANAVLVISKLGSGSDYFKSITDNCDLAWEDILFNHKVKAVDVGEIVDSDKNSSDFFVNMTSAGLSAHIVEKKSYMPRWLPGKLKYLLPTIHTLFRHNSNHVELATDDIYLNENILSLFISKGSYAGGGMKFAPNAKLDDGLLEITMIKKMSPFKLLSNFAKLYDGNFDQIQEIVKIKTPKIKIKSNTGIKLESDGEYLGPKNLEISVRHKAINVCVPNL